MAAHTLIVSIGVVATTACGGPISPGRIDAALGAQMDTPGIMFRFTPGDSVDADWQERFHEHITAEFGVSLPTKLRYNKYRDRSQLREVTNHDTNGFAEPDVFTVHSIFPHDGHEAVHVYSALVGRPSDFFNEGLAVALNSDPDAPVRAPPWNGTHVYAHTQLLIRTNQRRSLSTMMTTDGFRETTEWVGYGQAGSFLLFLIEQHGLGRMLAFFGLSARSDSLSRIDSNFQAVWGMSLAEAEEGWLAYIDTWSP